MNKADQDRKIANILSAVAAVDIRTHPIYDAIKSRHGDQWIGLDDHGIYTSAESVTLIGDCFTVGGDIGYNWTCKCHNEDIPDIESVLVTGRFIDERPVIETIALSEPDDGERELAPLVERFKAPQDAFSNLSQPGGLPADKPYFDELSGDE